MCLAKIVLLSCCVPLPRYIQYNNFLSYICFMRYQHPPCWLNLICPSNRHTPVFVAHAMHLRILSRSRSHFNYLSLVPLRAYKPNYILVTSYFLSAALFYLIHTSIHSSCYSIPGNQPGYLLSNFVPIPPVANMLRSQQDAAIPLFALPHLRILSPLISFRGHKVSDFLHTPAVSYELSCITFHLTP